LERRMGIDEHPSMHIAPDRPAVEPVDIRTARKAKEEAAPADPPRVDPPRAEPSGEPAAAEPAAPEPAAAESAAPVTLQQIKDAWPEILEIVKDSKRNAWMALAASTPRAYTGDVLTVAFATEADVASFKQPQGPGESVSEHLRGAIHDVLGVRVKFLARHEATPVQPQATASTPTPPVDENPLPPAPEWNVVSIPSSEPAPSKQTPPTASPEPSASVSPASAPVAEKRAPQQNTADGKARYGEAVVREILGASFIEEQTLHPVDPPAPLDSLDD
jgi:DNA polymerase-3 subunit gamma/tau